LTLSYDVKSSIYRVNYLLKKKDWLPDRIDMYNVFFDDYSEKKSSYLSTPITERFEEEREAVKKLCMRPMFDGKFLERNLKHAMNLNKWNSSATYQEAADININFLRDAMIDVLGDLTYNSEIFFHESNIYMDVQFELLKQGYYVWKCYDAFYATNPNNISNEEFEFEVEKIL